jgi:hypothetical protein
MMMNRRVAGLVTCAFLFSLVPDVQAFMADIGYTALQNELGAATPTGANVRVAHVEAPINDVSGLHRGSEPIHSFSPYWMCRLWRDHRLGHRSESHPRKGPTTSEATGETSPTGAQDPGLLARIIHDGSSRKR